MRSWYLNGVLSLDPTFLSVNLQLKLRNSGKLSANICTNKLTAKYFLATFGNDVTILFPMREK